MNKEKQEIEKLETAILKTNKLELAGINTTALTVSLQGLAIPRLFHQLIIFIIDGSNSMNQKSKNGISKAKEIDKGIKSIIQRLKDSKNNSSFDVCFLAFSDEFKDVFLIKNVNDILNEQSYNPLDFVASKGTKLNEALLHTKAIVNDYYLKNKLKNCQVLIQILSDGQIDDFFDSIKTAEEIKNIDKTIISCQFLESHIEEGQKWCSWNEVTGELNRNISWTIEEVKQKEKQIANKFKNFASSSDLFLTSIDPEEIRKHMIKSISTVSKLD